MNTVDSYSKAPKIFELKNACGTTIRIMDWGASILDVIVTLSKTGEQRNLVLGTSPEYYGNQHVYLGATIGRVANRTNKGSFKIGCNQYQITMRQGDKHGLHGGFVGFDKKRFTAKKYSKQDLILSTISPDGDQGFPGELILDVHYTLTDNNELIINYHATASALTPINITNHSYWNLDNNQIPEKTTIKNHKLTIFTDTYLPLNNEGIPLGEFAKVNDSIMDFRNPKMLNEVTCVPTILVPTKGLDHPYVFNNTPKDCKIKLESSDSNVSMEMYTDYPASHVYTSNYFDGTPSRIPNNYYKDYSSIAIEPEFYPNAINTPAFQDKCPLCGPNSEFNRFICFKFITK
jgi:aldose 1-epimerase